MSISHFGNQTWVLIADGEKALFLVNEGDAEIPVLNVRRKEEHENPPTREQGTAEPGRFSDSPARGGGGTKAGSYPQRSGFQETDWHELEKKRFADELAEMLYKRAHRGDFERIVLVAQPNMLSELRGKLHKEVQSRVVGEVPKTLTNHPVQEIESVLKGEIKQSA